MHALSSQISRANPFGGCGAGVALGIKTDGRLRSGRLNVGALPELGKIQGEREMPGRTTNAPRIATWRAVSTAQLLLVALGVTGSLPAQSEIQNIYTGGTARTYITVGTIPGEGNQYPEETSEYGNLFFKEFDVQIRDVRSIAGPYGGAGKEGTASSRLSSAWTIRDGMFWFHADSSIGAGAWQSVDYDYSTDPPGLLAYGYASASADGIYNFQFTITEQMYFQITGGVFANLAFWGIDRRVTDQAPESRRFGNSGRDRIIRSSAVNRWRISAFCLLGRTLFRP
jgi:hypothetical protein